MTPQRMTGIMCSALSLATGIFQGAEYGFDWLVQLCAGAFVVFAISIFWESQVMKGFQAATLFVIGAMMIFQNDDSSYIGIVITSLGWMYLYTYGFMAHGSVVKTLVGITGLVTVLAISTEGKFSSILLRSMMTAVIFTAIWINARHLIDKARRLDVFEKQLLEKEKNELKEENLVMREAGLILSKEVRSKGSENGPKG